MGGVSPPAGLREGWGYDWGAPKDLGEGLQGVGGTMGILGDPGDRGALGGLGGSPIPAGGGISWPLSPGAGGRAAIAPRPRRRRTSHSLWGDT